jgi:hypothetical protein
MIFLICVIAWLLICVVFLFFGLDQEHERNVRGLTASILLIPPIATLTILSQCIDWVLCKVNATVGVWINNG